MPRALGARIRHDVCMQVTTETHIYGEWPSPIDGADVARKQVGLTFPVIDAAGVWWQESRPEEGGRLAVVRQGPDGPGAGGRTKRDLLPMPWNARTRVHEYGGKSYLPLPDGFVFANFADQRLYRCGAAGSAGAPGPGGTDPRAERGDGRPVRRPGPVSRRGRGLVRQGAAWGWRPDHPGDRGGPAGRLRRGRSRRDPDPGQRLGLLRLPGAVTGRHPAGLDLLGPSPDALGRHRTAGRRAQRSRTGQRQGPAAADHGRRGRVGSRPGVARRPQPVRDLGPFRLVESLSGRSAGLPAGPVPAGRGVRRAAVAAGREARTRCWATDVSPSSTAPARPGWPCSTRTAVA